jgi:hypothetical protein
VEKNHRFEELSQTTCASPTLGVGKGFTVPMSWPVLL